MNGWGSGETAERRRQFVRPARADSRQPEAAQRGHASLAVVARGRRLDEPDQRGACGSRAACSTHTPSAATASPGRSSCGAGRSGRRLAAGVAQGAKEVTVGPVKDIAVQPGDLVSLLIGPRDGNHACDLTAVDLTLAGGGRDVEPGAGGFARRARGQSPRRCAGQSRRLALLHRARQGRPRRASDPGRLAAGPVAIGGDRGGTATAGARPGSSAQVGPAGGERQSGWPAVSPALIAARTARRAPSGWKGAKRGRPAAVV